jgi:metal-responsive CopG/Arc/MetJ family transcriptional regulator
MVTEPSMFAAKAKGRPSRGPTAMVSARISAPLVARLEFLTRNHHGVKSRSQAIETALRKFIEGKEEELRALGIVAPR